MLFAREMQQKSAEFYDKNTPLEDRLPAFNLAYFRIAYLMEISTKPSGWLLPPLALIGWLTCLYSLGRAVIIPVPLDNYS